MFIYDSTYDSKILDIQLNDFIIKYPKMLTNNNIFKVEHVNAQLKKYKRLSIRYDKYSNNYALFLHLLCINIILRHMSHKTI
jgi:hypothetical protein